MDIRVVFIVFFGSFCINVLLGRIIIGFGGLLVEGICFKRVSVYLLEKGYLGEYYVYKSFGKDSVFFIKTVVFCLTYKL